ncbi:MAG: TatD family hydrolase [Chloroflexota bacterium]|nr:TatD family hydrolase [Dehalococcoidia bacterium]MDW8046731.1 TatD family hydrolase [Chloroflexota bacterium]
MTPPPLADTHCHLQDPKIAARAETLVARAREAGVTFILVCGYDLPSSEQALRLAERFPEVWAAVGIHPHDARTFGPGSVAELEGLARHEKCVAIGEIGLDFYRELSPRAVQREALEAQLQLATELGLPVSIHSRGAEDAIGAHLERYAVAANALRAQGRPLGVMHCFGGDVAQAERYAELGFLISIACTIGYPKNERARDVARRLPLDVLVAETDAPYLPPQWARGQLNEPANVRAAVEGIAEARGISFADAAARTTANAGRLFAPAETPLAAREP